MAEKDSRWALRGWRLALYGLVCVVLLGGGAEIAGRVLLPEPVPPPPFAPAPSGPVPGTEFLLQGELDWYRADKGPKERRIGCVGGSVMAGPGPDSGICRMLTERLRVARPDLTVRYVNEGAWGEPSFKVAPRGAQLMAVADLDLLIVLSVHNEYLGLRVEMLEPANNGLVSFLQEHSALVQATAESRRHHITFGSAPGEPKEGRWVPLQATALRRSARWEELNAAVLDRYEQSLEYVVAAAQSHQVPIVLLHGARNPDFFQVLESHPPAGTGSRKAVQIQRENEELAASLGSKLPPADRLAQAEELLERQPWSSLAHYARAVALTGLERHDEAHDAYIQAHDLSAVPYAETTQTHARLRAVVERHDLPSASIGDWLLMGSPVGLPWPWLFSDDVHPNGAGYGRISDGLLGYLTEQGLITDW